MATERNSRRPLCRPVRPTARWLSSFTLLAACSVYDSSLLHDAVGGRGGAGGAEPGGASSGGRATEGGRDPSDGGRGGSTSGGETGTSGGKSGEGGADGEGGSDGGGGGSVSEGGSNASGGAIASGGESVGGNAAGSAGVTTGGGAPSSGGAAATGGTPATGGAATGGTLGSGGSAGGGTTGTGGGPAGTTLFTDDFESGKATRWTPNVAADWSIVTDGTFVYRESLVANALRVASAGDPAWTDQAVQARVKILAFSTTISASFFGGIFARYVDENNHYYVALRSDGKLNIRRKFEGTNSAITAAVTPGTALVANRWYTVKLEIVGTTLRGFIDGALFATVTDTSIAAGKVAVGTVNASAVFDDVVVTDPSP